MSEFESKLWSGPGPKEYLVVLRRGKDGSLRVKRSFGNVAPSAKPNEKTLSLWKFPAAEVTPYRRKDTWSQQISGISSM